MADPICTFLFSVFVLFTTFTIIRDILIVLMEGESHENGSTAKPPKSSSASDPPRPPPGAPAGLKYSQVREGLLAVNGVTAVHNLHIWALTMNQAVLTAHVAIGERLRGQTCGTRTAALVHHRAWRPPLTPGSFCPFQMKRRTLIPC